jgi:type IV pilus assembly protein PilW
MERQKGFTLVELMISGVIGVVVMASLMNLFITTNKSIALSDALSKNQESGRFGMDYMTTFIRKAGYSNSYGTATGPVLIQTPALTCLKDSIDNSCSANNPGDVHGDRLAIPYVADADNVSRSCSGTLVGGPENGAQQIANVFWVSKLAATQFELQCRTFDYGLNQWIDLAPVSIISGVESFEFQVGIAASEDDREASRYVNIDTLINDTTSTILNSVRSIRIALLTTSRDELDANKVKTTKKERLYQVLDGPIIKSTDGNLRQIFSTTIELPNMIETAAH